MTIVAYQARDLQQTVAGGCALLSFRALSCPSHIQGATVGGVASRRARSLTLTSRCPRTRQTLYESAVAFGIRKALQTEQGKSDLEARVHQLEGDNQARSAADITRKAAQFGQKPGASILSPE